MENNQINQIVMPGNELKDEQVYRKILGKVVTGVSILTLNENDELDGLMVSFVQQIAFNPPMLMISIAKDRPIIAKIKKVIFATLNILAKDNHEFFKAFAGPNLSSQERFGLVNYEKQADYGPILLKALGFINLRLTKSSEAGCHEVLFFTVDGGQIFASNGEPMVHIRNDGLKY